MLFFLRKSLEYVYHYFSKLKKNHYINTCSENDKTWFIDYFWTATYLSFEKIKTDRILHFDNYCTSQVLKCMHSWMYIVYVPISDQKYFLTCIINLHTVNYTRFQILKKMIETLFQCSDTYCDVKEPP